MVQVGIVVTCENLYNDLQWKVCQAYATFVARGSDMGKVSLHRTVRCDCEVRTPAPM